jgi:hypothetical protein
MEVNIAPFIEAFGQVFWRVGVLMVCFITLQFVAALIFGTIMTSIYLRMKKKFGSKK